jgi:3-hydroxybenzoate 6-monooxygenase
MHRHDLLEVILRHCRNQPSLVLETAKDVTRSRSSAAQRTARTWGEIWHVDGLAMALRDEAFRLRAEDDLSRIDWLYRDSVA